jgi:mono/diheme cytochrome c family protein
MKARLAWAAGVLAAAIAAPGCETPQKSSRGFHLPDGDPARGRRVFVQMRCHACHEVAGEDFPAPIADPPVDRPLGGVVPYAKTDGYLATAVLDPSHWIAPGSVEEVRYGRLSRMGDFRDSMTVSELVDVVAYLQSRYTVRPPRPNDVP